MPSADFCVLTRRVSTTGATGLLMSCCIICVSHRDSYPPTAAEYAWSLVNRLDHSGNNLMCLLSRDAQISPDKNVNFPCTNAAFILLPNLWASLVLCLLAQELNLVCGFCPSSRTFALRLPSDPSSRRRPCLRLVLLSVYICMFTFGSRTGDFHPISSRPCRAYTNR
jgi:hypothetical protein